MAEETFSRLASELNLDERQNLLERLDSQPGLSKEPLYEEPDEAADGLENRYHALAWYLRLWYSFLGLLNARPAKSLFEESQIAALGRRIDRQSPGLYHCQRFLLLPGFLAQLERLRDAARFFHSALDAGVNRDKGACFAFLGSLEMPEVHKRLTEAADPAALVKALPGAGEQELRRAAAAGVDEALSLLKSGAREAMYADARALLCLKELSSFLYDRLILAFGFDPALNGQVCPVNMVKELLNSLNNILFSLKAIPPMPLLESIFLFQLQERADGADGPDLTSGARGLLAKAEDALAVIREFNKQVPLTLILRCAYRDLSLTPEAVPGGEDWLVTYREYWKRLAGERLTAFLREERRRELAGSFSSFLKGNVPQPLDNIKSDTCPDGLPVAGAFHLSFLLAFYSAVFMPEINKTLRAILIDGDFYQKDTKSEFTSAYNTLIKLEDDIRGFESRVSPAGDYGKLYRHLRADMSSLQARRRKIQTLLEEAAAAAKKITSAVEEALAVLANVLSAVAGKGESPLANTASLSEKNSRFLTDAAETVPKLQQTLRILENITLMEEE
ncbi:MAG: DUF5312 domain-containing protein [Treponematales bacterium]